MSKPSEGVALAPAARTAGGGTKKSLTETEGSGPRCLSTVTNTRISLNVLLCTLQRAKSSNTGAPAKSGGKECLPRVLPQGQTPGKNSWDYLVLSKMDLEPPRPTRDVALDPGCQDWSVVS